MRTYAQRTVVITGAAGGLGAALVKCFLAQGAHVAALDRDVRALAILAQAHAGTPLLTVCCDVTDEAA